jgi:flavodoxin
MKTDLFYYTGTGNSLWTAKMLAKEMGDADIIPISSISENPIVTGAEAIGMIFPVHIWGLPRRVIAFVDALEKNGSRYYRVCKNEGGYLQPGNYFPEDALNLFDICN